MILVFPLWRRKYQYHFEIGRAHVWTPVTENNLVCRLLLEKNFFNDTATTEIYTLSLHDALPIYVIAAKKVRIIINYEMIDKLNYILQDFKITYKEFSDKVSYEVLVPDDKLNLLESFPYEIINDCFITQEKRITSWNILVILFYYKIRLFY